MTELQAALSLVLVMVLLIVALAICLGYIASLRLAAKDAQVQSIVQERNAYRLIGEQAVYGLETLANRNRDASGLPTLPPVLGIVPAHDSPITQRNQDAADVGNLRARIAVVAVDLGLTPLISTEVLEYEPVCSPVDGGRMPTSDLVVSSAALAVFTTMLTAVISALIGLFWLAWREKQKSYDELKLQYDARYNDVKGERDRLLNVQAQSDRDMMAILAIIKDGVLGGAATMATIATAIASMQQVIERLTRPTDRG